MGVDSDGCPSEQLSASEFLLRTFRGIKTCQDPPHAAHAPHLPIPSNFPIKKDLPRSFQDFQDLKLDPEDHRSYDTACSSCNMEAMKESRMGRFVSCAKNRKGGKRGKKKEERDDVPHIEVRTSHNVWHNYCAHKKAPYKQLPSTS